MSRTSGYPFIVGLCVLLLLVISGCSDSPGHTDTGPGPGAQLDGNLVPAGGVSMNDNFTLSGHLSSGTPEQVSSNESFSLTIKQFHSKVAP